MVVRQINAAVRRKPSFEVSFAAANVATIDRIPHSRLKSSPSFTSGLTISMFEGLAWAFTFYFKNLLKTREPDLACVSG